MFQAIYVINGVICQYLVLVIPVRERQWSRFGGH